MISRYVLIRRLAELTGYTIKAMQPTTGNGVWIEQREWSLAPNGQPMIDIKGFSATARARKGTGLPDARRLHQNSLYIPR